MKIKRFFAQDMRQAIRQVRESFGPEAVILSNKSVDGGVELVAARDYDGSEIGDKQRETGESGIHKYADELLDLHNNGSTAPTSDLPAKSKKSRADMSSSRVEWSQDPILVEMRQEMRFLRRMMENELSELTWRDLGQRRPETQEVIRRLMGMDLSPELCRDLSEQVQDISDADQAWRKSLHQLAARIPVTNLNTLEYGGVVAVIGPTGVGKTTSVAKLAARYCLRNGNRSLALITTDNFRIGAEEQLQDYARILDVPVRTAASTEELNAALNAFADKRLVLIDTAGMSHQDRRMGKQLEMLTAGNKPVSCLLILAATTQGASLSMAVRAYSEAKPNACILTKVDETASLGSVFSTLIEHRLPLAFTADGQRVPEDIHIARAHALVSQAVLLSQQVDNQYTDDYLAVAMGGLSGHAYV